MKTRLFSIFLTLFLLSTLFLTNTFAQDYTQLNLPQGAKARLGKGVITDMQLSADGTRLAVASSIGVWLYDIRTGSETVLISGKSECVIWDIATRRKIAEFPQTSNVRFFGDGKTLAIIEKERSTMAQAFNTKGSQQQHLCADIHTRRKNLGSWNQR